MSYYINYKFIKEITKRDKILFKFNPRFTFSKTLGTDPIIFNIPKVFFVFMQI
jgi:hypothetical protein